MERDSVTALFAIRDNRDCTCLLISCVRRNCVGCIEEAVVQCRSLKHRVAVVTRMRRQSRKGVEKGGGQRDGGVASVRFPLTRDLYIVSNLCHGKWNVNNVEKYRRTDHFLRLIPLSLFLFFPSVEGAAVQPGTNDLASLRVYRYCAARAQFVPDSDRRFGLTKYAPRRKEEEREEGEWGSFRRKVLTLAHDRPS